MNNSSFNSIISYVFFILTLWIDKSNHFIYKYEKGNAIKNDLLALSFIQSKEKCSTTIINEFVYLEIK